MQRTGNQIKGEQNGSCGQSRGPGGVKGRASVLVSHFYCVIKGDDAFTVASCVLLITLLVRNLGRAEKFCKTRASQNFLEAAYRSSLIWCGWRCGGGGGSSSCLFIHSNQESAEQEQRLGSGGALPH